jgi:hypothetical protein
LAVVEAALSILDDAYDIELGQAPSFREVMFSLTGFAIAVAALGIAFVPPVDDIANVVAAAIAVLGALWSFADLGSKIHKDIDTSERLRAIDRAKETLRALVP